MSASWAIPVGLVLFGAMILGAAWWTSWRFDRRHPNSTRAALRDRDQDTAP